MSATAQLRPSALPRLELLLLFPTPPLPPTGWKPSASRAGAAGAASRASGGARAVASPAESSAPARSSGSSPTRSRRSSKFLMTWVGLFCWSRIFILPLSVHAACSLPRRFSWRAAYICVQLQLKCPSLMLYIRENALIGNVHSLSLLIVSLSTYM